METGISTTAADGLTAAVALGFDYPTRSVAPVDPRAAVHGGTDPRRYVWIDLTLGDPARDRAALHALGPRRARILERAIRATPLDRAGHDAGSLHLQLTDCRVGQDGLVRQQLDLVLEERLMVTVHRGPSRLAEDLRRHVPEEVRLALSPTFLLYEVGARLLDAYRTVQTSLEQRLAALQERAVVSDPGAVAAIPGLDAELLAFRRAVVGARNALSELGGRRSPFVCEATRPYLSSMALALDRLQHDTLASREILSSTLGLDISATSARAARALGRLTALTVIFLPMLFGVQVAKADLDWTSPWAGLWALAALNVAGVIGYMRRHRLL
jgi:Mg2+ and Co2+ transporter CorA